MCASMARCCWDMHLPCWRLGWSWRRRASVCRRHAGHKFAALHSTCRPTVIAPQPVLRGGVAPAPPLTSRITGSSTRRRPESRPCACSSSCAHGAQSGGLFQQRLQAWLPELTATTQKQRAPEQRRSRSGSERSGATHLGAPVPATMLLLLAVAVAPLRLRVPLVPRADHLPGWGPGLLSCRCRSGGGGSGSSGPN